MGTKITNFDGIKAFASKTGAACAILIATSVGIPISTSHVTFGAICGSAIAEKLTGIPNVMDKKNITRIMFVWLVKIPVSMFCAMYVFYEFKGIFLGYKSSTI